MADTKNLSQLFAPTAPVAPVVEDPSLQARIKDRPLDVGIPAAKPITNVKQLDQLTTETRKGLDAENQEWLALQTNKLKALNEEAARAYKEKTSRTEKAELAEIIGHALAQIGYGMAGLKSNTYGGPLKFNKIDWERKYDRTLDEYKTKLGLNKDELDYDATSMKTRGSERSKLAEDRLSMSERTLREYQDRIDEERRKAEKEDKIKKGPKLETADKILEEFREIDKLKALYDEAEDDKSRTKLMGEIYVKLGEQGEGSKDIKKLNEMAKAEQIPWYNFWSDKSDEFGKLIETQKKKRLDELAGRNQSKLAEEGQLPGPVLTPPAASGIIDKATLEDADKRRQRIEELRKKAGK
jgi:hypothetical protein